MAFLTIKGKEYEAKCNFLFERTANRLFGKEDAKTGKKEGGFEEIYTGLIEESNEAIVQFWECALAGERDKKLTKEAIEDAIMERIEEEGDTRPIIREILDTIDESGFFKRPVEKFWKNVDLMKEIGSKDEMEAKQLELAYKRLKEGYKEIKGAEEETE